MIYALFDYTIEALYLTSKFISEGTALPEASHPRLIYCYAVQCSIPSPRLPMVERILENEVAHLRYKSETLKMNQEHFWKMVCDIYLKSYFSILI